MWGFKQGKDTIQLDHWSKTLTVWEQSGEWVEVKRLQTSQWGQEVV